MTAGTRKLRMTFDVTPRGGNGYRSYDVRCMRSDCDWEAKAWDWRRNALAAGYEHAIQHDEPITLAIPDTMMGLLETLKVARTALSPWSSATLLSVEQLAPHRDRIANAIEDLERQLDERGWAART